MAELLETDAKSSSVNLKYIKDTYEHVDEKDTKLNNDVVSTKSDEVVLDYKENIQLAMQFKKIANDLFNKKSFTKSIEYFNKALEHLNFNQAEIFNQSNINTIKIDCLNNISICYLLKKDHEKVLEYTSQVIFLIRFFI